MTWMYVTRMKINVDKLSAPLRKQFNEGLFSYNVTTINKFTGKTDPHSGKFKPKDHGCSEGVYWLESSKSNWSEAKSELKASWVIYADKTAIWWGDAQNMFSPSETRWNIPNITRISTEPAKPVSSDKNAPVTPAIKHISSIKFVLYAREAASFGYKDTKVGSAGAVISPSMPSLHFTLMIEDLRDGVWGTDGQPSGINPITAKLISNFYINTYPNFIILKVSISPPSDMTSNEFKKRLMQNAYNFDSNSLDYSFPENVGTGSVMDDGEYNSSSYMAGLLKSVLGYVPKISISGYQIPGWENPVPSSFFRHS